MGVRNENKKNKKSVIGYNTLIISKEMKRDRIEREKKRKMRWGEKKKKVYICALASIESIRIGG